MKEENLGIEVKSSQIDIDNTHYKEDGQAILIEDNSVYITESTETSEENQISFNESDEELAANKRELQRERAGHFSGIFGTIVATAVVAVAVVFSDAPITNITQFDIGSDYVTYSADIINETGKDLVLTISSDSFTDEVPCYDGVIQRTITGLKPNTKYNFVIKAANGLQESFLKREFKTAKDPTDYPANISDVKVDVNKDTNQIQIQFYPDDIYGHWSNYSLSIKNELGQELLVPIPDIKKSITIDTSKLSGSFYTLTLSVDTMQPSDIKNKISNKVVYSAVIQF